MTLGELIKVLGKHDPDKVLPFGWRNPHSYRGYYDELAFEPVWQATRVSDLLDVTRSALGSTFQGWKGGDYVMDEHTHVWLAEEGHSGGEPLSAPFIALLLCSTSTAEDLRRAMWPELDGLAAGVTP